MLRLFYFIVIDGLYPCKGIVQLIDHKHSSKYADHLTNLVQSVRAKTYLSKLNDTMVHANVKLSI